MNDEFDFYKNPSGEAGIIRAIWAGSDCPDGWSVRNVGDSVTVTAGKAFSSEDFSKDPSRGTPLIKRATVNNNRPPETSLTTEFDDKYAVEEGDILVSMDGHFNGVLWQNGLGALNQRVCRLDPDNVLNAPYLAYALQTPLDYIEAATGATTVKSLSTHEFDFFDLPVPPRAEQERIASVLYTVDQLLDTTQQLIENHERIRGRLNTALFAQFISEYSAKNLGDLLEIRNGKYLKKSDRGVDSGTPVYGANGIIGYTNKEGWVPRNELAIGRVGACGEVHQLPVDSWVSDNAMVTTEVDERLLREFLREFLVYSDLKKYAAGNVQQKIVQDDILGLDIPLPPISEQRGCVNVIETVDHRLTHLQERVNKLHRIKTGLMQDLLSGNIRTPKSLEVRSEVADA